MQEAFLRFHRESLRGIEVESPKAYLSAVTTRFSIDQLRSARVRRESYVGTWLPEPLLTDTESDPTRHAETADSLSLGFLVLLESLTPVERAVFLLREVFDYGYDEIATVVGKNEDNCRQIAVRARRQVQSGKPRFEASRERRKSWPAGSSKRPRRGTPRPSSACSPPTSWRTRRRGQGSRRSRVRSTGEIRSPGLLVGGHASGERLGVSGMRLRGDQRPTRRRVPRHRRQAGRRGVTRYRRRSRADGACGHRSGEAGSPRLGQFVSRAGCRREQALVAGERFVGARPMEDHVGESEVLRSLDRLGELVTGRADGRSLSSTR